MEWPDFSFRDKELIRLVWKQVENDKVGLGVDIYKMIFDQCPEAKLLFPFLKYNADGSEVVNNEFSFQALRFVQVLESGVQHLDHLQSMDNILNNLGRRHGRLKAAVGFKQCYWVVFRECALYQIRKNLELPRKHSIWTPEKVDEALILWRFLLHTIIERIEIGYEQDLKNRSYSVDERGEDFFPRKLTGKSTSIESGGSGSRKTSNQSRKEDIAEAINFLNPFKKRGSSGSAD
ncbi:unnamed protein product [Bursaphelenchus xylophilus]|uniref:(pine wood nematode) hypothetical protein n=1 Tax=Bursaphelenchus xylophilus TaxID=6326 RepID=A0A7I8WU93_BURXY|nr:unnamed protein product [Bursaphelenchus xylophilus]CAG9116561.1 unnamed protein product [Bursaphelenchus xylophilus]